MKNKSVATIRFHPQNKEIWDYRALNLKIRLRIALSLFFTGIVEIQWKKINEINYNE